VQLFLGDKMKTYTANDIKKKTGIDYKHVWRYVRRLGIEPHIGEQNRLCITDTEFNAFLVALESGVIEVKSYQRPQKKRDPQTEYDAMRERVTVAQEPQPVKRPGYLYIPAVGAGRPFDWAASVGK
jgi:hypothetical protein